MDEEKKEIIEVEKVNDIEKINETEKIENVQKQKTQNNDKKQPQKDRKGFCIASLVLGIVALVLFCVWYLSIPCGILAVIFGILGMKASNKGMAIAGLITGSIGLVISTLIIIMLFVFGFAMGVSGILDEVDDNNYYHRYNNNFYN